MHSPTMPLLGARACSSRLVVGGRPAPLLNDGALYLLLTDARPWRWTLLWTRADRQIRGTRSNSRGAGSVAGFENG